MVINGIDFFSYEYNVYYKNSSTITTFGQLKQLLKKLANPLKMCVVLFLCLLTKSEVARASVCAYSL